MTKTLKSFDDLRVSGDSSGNRFSRASRKTVHRTVFSPIGEHATKVARS